MWLWLYGYVRAVQLVHFLAVRLVILPPPAHGDLRRGRLQDMNIKDSAPVQHAALVHRHEDEPLPRPDFKLSALVIDAVGVQDEIPPAFFVARQVVEDNETGAAVNTAKLQ